MYNSKKYNLTEASDIYDNVNFKDGVVGGSSPSKDNINLSLLQDVQTAAKNANLKVDITTAVSGHDSGTRHESGNAVDIAIINGKSVSSSNRGDADKLVGELIKLGYVKNQESGNDKAVLTFGVKGHDNHVHVSKKSNNTSTSSNSTDNTSSDSEGGYLSSYADNIGKALMKTISPNGSSINVMNYTGLKEDIDRIKELLK
jgi:hypothetical protein